MIQHSDFSGPFPPSSSSSKSSLPLKLTSFSHSVHTSPSIPALNQLTLLNIYSTPALFLHVSHLSANPFFIASWSVFPPLVFLCFVTGFHHSSVARVCHGTGSCCSLTLLVLFLGLSVSVRLIISVFIRTCVCLCGQASEHYFFV